ncbi:lipopolysaccharide transport system permease protein [Paenibacillus sp. V4I9]|uniref:ABC transporter permease n=1 Tax=Paenibacillus sp. V4I9 TaxID=3042308 RepID=UPI002781E8D5|nr:ABC transporter permease [Paenibacillus sp. V4I9]MDQ0890940.1 lipopolysaccharide transport system permease protein [Paenibacillus sp. V4I9]
MFVNPLNIFKNLWNHRELIKSFAKREVLSKYKGSFLGIMWSFINPLLMLIVYTFVFSEIFNAKWNTASNSKVEFAIIIFCGLITFSIFGDVISRAPYLVLSNANYVKKVVFPLEILPVVALGSAVINSLISMGILVLCVGIFMHVIEWTLIFIPLVLCPLMLLSLGLGWFLSSLGVYLRDIAQIVTVAVQALMLLSPIMYPATLIPKDLLFLYYLNPIGYVVEDMRRIIIWGELPNWSSLGIETIIGLVIFYMGYAWFQKTRSGFSDVI